MSRQLTEDLRLYQQRIEQGVSLETVDETHQLMLDILAQGLVNTEDQLVIFQQLGIFPDVTDARDLSKTDTWTLVGFFTFLKTHQILEMARQETQRVRLWHLLEAMPVTGAEVMVALLGEA